MFVTHIAWENKVNKKPSQKQTVKLADLQYDY